jgi:hypothetical protein
MPTADATLLLPPPFTYDDDADHEAHSHEAHLHGIGVEAVLGAMIEQKRRASQPAFPAYREASGTNEIDTQADSDTSPPPSARTARAPTRSEVFLKAR